MAAAKEKIQKLSKMQINRMESELNKKINERMQEARLANNPNSGDRIDKRSEVNNKLKDRVEKLYFSTHKNNTVLPYYMKNNMSSLALDLGRMMKLPEAKELDKLDKEAKKINTANNKKNTALQTSLNKKRDKIMNDAYFRDAKFALEALENF